MYVSLKKYMAMKYLCHCYVCMNQSVCMYECTVCRYVVTQSHPEQSFLRHRTANEISIRFERVGIHLLGDLIHIGFLDKVRRSILNLIFFLKIRFTFYIFLYTVYT